MNYLEFNEKILNSISTEGILTKKVLLERNQSYLGSADSIENGDNGLISVNVLNQKHAKNHFDDSLKQLVYNLARGIIPLSIERDKNSQNEAFYNLPQVSFCKSIENRVQHVVVLVLDAQMLPESQKFGIGRQSILQENANGECFLDSCIDRRAIKHIFAPESLKLVVDKVFKDVSIEYLKSQEEKLFISISNDIKVDPKYIECPFMKGRSVTVYVPAFHAQIKSFASEYFKKMNRQNEPLVFHAVRLSTPEEV